MNEINPFCTYSELKKLEVINVYNGKKHGYILDMEYDLILGKISAILIPKNNSIFNCFKRKSEICIKVPYSEIQRIGNDTILVRIKE